MDAIKAIMEQIEASGHHLTEKQQKAIDIAAKVVSAVMQMQSLAPVAFPPKRIFRKKDRRPLKRTTKQRAKMSLMMEPYFTGIDLMKIMATPSYPKGSHDGPIGIISIVGDHGQEVIIRPEGKLKPILPPR